MFKVKKQRKDGRLIQQLKGKPAPCHPDRVMWARGMCKNCYGKWLTKTNPEYHKKQIENCKRWCKTHKKQNAAIHKRWRVKQDPLYRRIQMLRLQYGMTLEDYDKMLIGQNGVCFVCQKPPKDGKNLHVDHDHKTGHVRGLLCFRCNFGLSYFDGNKKIIENLHRYINR